MLIPSGGLRPSAIMSLEKLLLTENDPCKLKRFTLRDFIYGQNEHNSIKALHYKRGTRNIYSADKKTPA